MYPEMTLHSKSWWVAGVILTTMVVMSALLFVPAFAARSQTMPGSCSVPSATHPTIQAAIDDVTCNTILVNAGTFSEHLMISRSLELQGNGSGSTVIDGGNNGRVLNIDGNGIVVLISNLRVTNGNASNENPTVGIGRIGGGILIDNGATLYLSSVLVDHNLAFTGPTRTGFGGGIGVFRGSALYGEAITVSNNIASSGANTGFGGGVAVVDGAAVFTDSTFSANEAKPQGSGSGLGGALYAAGNAGAGRAVLTVRDSTISDNVARSSTTGTNDARGGGLYVGESTDTDIVLEGNAWQENVAREATTLAGDGDGGAVAVVTLNATATISITDDIFNGNIANNSNNTLSTHSAAGGAIFLDSNDAGSETNISAAFSALTMTDNVGKSGTGDAVGQGGALYAAESDLFLTDLWIEGNKGAIGGSGQGGGIRLSGAPLTGDSLTVLDNIAREGSATAPFLEGGGLHTSGAGSFLTLTNSIFGANSVSAIGGNGAGLYVNYSGVGLNEVARLTHVTVADAVLNDSQAIYYTGSAGDRAYLTNTIVVSHTVGIQNQGATGTLEENYTLYFGNTSNTVGSVVGNQGTITGNPAFTDAPGNNFHISAVSAARDSGTNAGVGDDIDGDTRPDGAGFDIGADEYTAAPPPTTTPTHTGTPTTGPSPTSTATPTTGPSPTATQTATAGPSPTPTQTATAGPSATPTQTETPGPSPTATGTPELSSRLFLPLVTRE